MKAELLAPAGSYEGLQAVVKAGADAVYIGGSMFGARAYANNPQQDEMLEAIDYAHIHGKTNLFDGKYPLKIKSFTDSSMIFWLRTISRELMR